LFCSVNVIAHVILFRQCNRNTFGCLKVKSLLQDLCIFLKEIKKIKKHKFISSNQQIKKNKKISSSAVSPMNLSDMCHVSVPCVTDLNYVH
jgi:hypothetical protein